MSIHAEPDAGYVFNHWNFFSEEAEEDFDSESQDEGFVVEYDWEIRAYFIIDEDDPDERVTDELPSGGTPGKCYLAFYANITDSSPRAVLNLPNIQSIEESDNAQLSEISTVIYGYDDNFVMDTGTIQKYTVTFTRVQPKNVQSGVESTDFDDQYSWSNGHWYKMFKWFTERWQNLNYGKATISGVTQQNTIRTGGFMFYYDPIVETYRNNQDMYTDLYPTVYKSVFLLGSVSMRITGNDLQKMTISVPLTVGSMVRQRAVARREVKYVSTEGNLLQKVYYPDYPMFPVSGVPNEWLSSSALGLLSLEYWESNASGKDDTGAIRWNWYPGMMVKDYTVAISQMSAHWKHPTRVISVPYSDTDDGELIITDLSNITGTNTARIWIVGGGGGGGGGRRGSQQLGTEYRGAGGGSGGYDCKVTSINTSGLASIQFLVGEGGSGGSGLNTGSDGDPSSIVFNYTNSSKESLAYASGGGGGKSEGWGGVAQGGIGGEPNGASGSQSGTMASQAGGDGAAVPALKDGLRVGSYLLMSVGGTKGVASAGHDGTGYGAGGGGAGTPSSGDVSGGKGSNGYILIAFYA